MVRRIGSLAIVLVVGCASRFDGRVYRGEGFAFAVPPLRGHWRQVNERGAALAFRDSDSSGTILITARCGQDGDDVPLSALTQHLFLSFTRRDIEQQTVVPFDGREAMHTSLSAELDGVPMRYEVWVMKKDGCVYDLLYFAPPSSFARGQASFAELVQGFTTAVPHE
jgi:hypothetical protein